jgi:Ca2+-transporting ATPase
MHLCFARVGELPFSSERKLMSTAHTHATEPASRTTLFVKGAPDLLLARCRAEQVGESERALTTRRHEIRLIDALADKRCARSNVAFLTNWLQRCILRGGRIGLAQ